MKKQIIIQEVVNDIMEECNSIQASSDDHDDKF